MSRILLMESLLGHMALLAERYPKKAASTVTKRAKREIKRSLQDATAPLGRIAPAAADAKPLRRAA